MRNCLLAVVLSLLMHAGVLLPFLLSSAGGSKGQAGGSLEIDTRVLAKETALHVSLWESPSPPDRVTPSAPVVQAAADQLAPRTLSPAAEGAPSSLSELGFSSPNSGGEEQELATGQNGARSGFGSSPVDSGSARFFGIPAQGQTVVYVIDRSASMGLHGFLAVAKRELLASLANLPPRARFQVIVYHRIAEPLCIAARFDLAPATEENKHRVAALLESLDAEGGTDHLAALKRALTFQAEEIFFLTDAADLTDQQIRAIKLLNRGRSRIHTIELTTSAVPGQSALQVLAQENRGQYRSLVIGH